MQNRYRIRGRKGQAIRARILSASPLCGACQAKGFVTLAAEVDHVLPLAEGGADTDENKQSLCVDCHKAKTRSESLRGIRAFNGPRPLAPEYVALRLPEGLMPSAIPCTIVAGPPGSGKSTYVAKHAQASDIVIDLDRIMAQFSGLREHHTDQQWLKPALDERNRQLRALATDTTRRRAWFIVAAPNAQERGWWTQQLGAQIVVMDTTLDECIRRIRADLSRSHAADRMIAATRDWFAVSAATLKA